jgi:hypothetical protein
MFSWLSKKLTKNYTKVPLLWIMFDLTKYNKYGAKDSCLLKIHPELKGDDYIKETLNSLVDYIRNNWNMNHLVNCGCIFENEHVYCTDCIHFKIEGKHIDGIGIPTCDYEDECDITDCEDSRPFRERPYYEENINIK